MSQRTPEQIAIVRCHVEAEAIRQHLAKIADEIGSSACDWHMVGARLAAISRCALAGSEAAARAAQ